MKNVGVIGAGAWGTALAVAARRAGARVRIWGRDRDVVASINRTHRNASRLPAIALHPDIVASAEPADLAACDMVLLAVPAQQVRSVCAIFAPVLDADIAVVICAKGIERGSRMAMSAVVGEALQQARIAVLSGPSFAVDVARGLPTAVTLACSDGDLGRSIAETIGSMTFRPYYTDDVTGTEIGGAAKNVLAIAAGIVAGKGLGASASAALTTRGFAELARLGLAMGARAETLSGLSGLGDLILTCGSLQSRNMAFGHALGTGKSVEQAMAAATAVSEGVWTASALVELAREKGIEMPISQAVDDVIGGRSTIDEAIRNLLARPFRAESG